MKRNTFLMLATIIVFFLSIGQVYASDSNCSDCHHLDFQVNPIDRATACAICHNATHGNSYSVLQNANTYGFEVLHDSHHYSGQVIPDVNISGCLSCHRMTGVDPEGVKVYCKTCHTNVAHENHGHVSATGFYTNNDNPGNAWPNKNEYKQRTFSCINSNCHATYRVWSGTGVIKKPSCTNCHAQPPNPPIGVAPRIPHGEQSGPNDKVDAKVTPNGTNPTTNSDIAITWMFQAGDTMAKSLDGITWTNINIGAPAVGSNYTYTDSGILNWTIVYYKVTHADASNTYFPVFPPGANAHINYLNNTKACGLCHLTHSSDQRKLLKEQTIEDLCRTCHGMANTGSRYNVDSGEIVVAGAIDSDGLITATAYQRTNSGAFGLPSGGKLYAGANAWGGAEVTSTHSTSSNVSNIAPGGGHNALNLTCTNCHLSHPKKNATGF